MEILSEGGDFIGEGRRLKNFMKLIKHIVLPLTKGLYIYRIKAMPLDYKTALVCFDENNFNYNEEIINYFKINYIVSRVEISSSKILLVDKVTFSCDYSQIIDFIIYALCGKYKKFESLLLLVLSYKTSFSTSELYFTNDQTPFSGMILKSIECNKSFTVQHGVINIPRYYFPTKTDHFFCWEKKWQVELGEKKIAINKYDISSHGFCSLKNTNSFLIATHSLKSCLKCIKKIKTRFFQDKNIFLKIHPTSKMTLLYKILCKFYGIKIFEKKIDRYSVNNFDGLVTEFSTLSLDFRYYGKAVISITEFEDLPEYMKKCVGVAKSKDLLHSLEEIIYI